MPVDRIVLGQVVNEELLQLAKLLRQNMTDAEKTLWKQIRTNKLDGYHFRRQQIIYGFIVDFYCHEAALIIEIDGEIHRNTKEYDYERESILRNSGFRIIRFSNDDIENRLSYVLNSIRSACKNGR